MRKKPNWAFASGLDEYGRWADLKVSSENGEAIQRFRWIEPGEFLMGSSTTEQDRNIDEGPQHRVYITRGYWLADTSCTQAFWKSVMGSNPSVLTNDDSRPVDSVSYDDCEHFMTRLGLLLSGNVSPILPSEAEWEYACRAGSYLRYSFGDEITANDANYRREVGSTVQVKFYSPNSWGLHEMHGNVWEWCRDGRRQFVIDDTRDPVGPQDGVGRVLRGGSWLVDGDRCRSAYRHSWHRDSRRGDIGFRLSLRL